MEKRVLLKTNLFICFIVILGFTITSLVSYHSNSGIFRQDVEHISTLTSEGIYHQIDSIFTKPINISLTMANDSLLKEFLNEEEKKADDEAFIQTMRNYLLAYKEKYNYDSVFLVSSKTRRYYHYNEGVDRILEADNPENIWYYSFLDTQEEYDLNIDNDEVELANNEITIFINCKIKGADGQIMGVVGVGFRVDYLQKMFREYEREFDVKAYLVDSEGTIEISTDQTGYKKTDLFKDCGYKEWKTEILSKTKEAQAYWYSSGGKKGYLVTQYVPNLEWHLMIENDTTKLENKLSEQFYISILIIVLVIALILIVITNIIGKYNARIVRLTIEKEKKHRSVLQAETEKFYENIYEIDITHNRAASEATEDYFSSLGVPRNTPYDKALSIIAEKQLKREYREGYLSMFCPENILKAYKEGKESLCYDFMISNDEGRSYYWMRITVRIFFWDDDKSVRIFAFRQNIDEEKRHEKYLFEKMESDSLTGIYNKAATQMHIQKKLMEEKERSFAFFMLDIDNFKNVNDTCGHAVGDMVITDFVRIMKENFGEEDIAGRIGGDEFVIFAPAPSAEWVEKKAQKLVMALYHEFSDGTVRRRVSASIGVAISPEAGGDFETLYKNADAALYKIKENGKNGYSIYK